MCKCVKTFDAPIIVHFFMKYGSNIFAPVSTKIPNHPDFLLPGRSFFEQDMLGLMNIVCHELILV